MTLRIYKCCKYDRFSSTCWSDKHRTMSSHHCFVQLKNFLFLLFFFRKLKMGNLIWLKEKKLKIIIDYTIKQKLFIGWGAHNKNLLTWSVMATYPSWSKTCCTAAVNSGFPTLGQSMSGNRSLNFVQFSIIILDFQRFD